MNSKSRIISTDEDPSLRIESSSIINLRCVSTKLNKYKSEAVNTRPPPPPFMSPLVKHLFIYPYIYLFVSLFIYLFVYLLNFAINYHKDKYNYTT